MDNMEGRQEVKRRVTPRMATFLFGLNVLAVLFLLTGFALPGWLTVTTRQELTNFNGEDTYDLVYQDYGIWFVTQCTWAKVEPYGSSCDTRSFRLLEYLDERRVSYISVHFIGRSELFFSGFGLVFSKTSVTTFQTLYTLAIAVSVILLIMLHSLRAALANRSYTVPLQKKIFMVILAIITVISTFVPVGIFSKAREKLHQPMKEFGNAVESSLGIVFGGIGGGLMIILLFSIIVCHFMDCPCAFEENPRELPVSENRQQTSM